MNRRAFLFGVLCAPFVAAWRRLVPAPVVRPPLTVEGVTLAVQQYRARCSVNWVALCNDDLAIFATLPARLANAANRSIDSYYREEVRKSKPGARRYYRRMERIRRAA